jgi:hypothetical protein
MATMAQSAANPADAVSEMEENVPQKVNAHPAKDAKSMNDTTLAAKANSAVEGRTSEAPESMRPMAPGNALLGATPAMRGTTIKEALPTRSAAESILIVVSFCINQAPMSRQYKILPARQRLTRCARGFLAFWVVWSPRSEPGDSKS